MSGFTQVARKPKRKVKAKYTDLTPQELATNYQDVVRRYKTEKCKKGWLSHAYNSCPAGKYCFDAHSELDLRRDPLKGDVSVPLYDRALCPQYSRSRTCSNGKTCKQAHNETEVMYHPRMYKSKGCNMANDCARDNLCAFIHPGDILTPALRAALFFGGAKRGEKPAPAPSHDDDDRAAPPPVPAQPMPGFEPHAGVMPGFEQPPPSAFNGASYSFTSSPVSAAGSSQNGFGQLTFAQLDLNEARGQQQQQGQQHEQQRRLLQQQRDEEELREREMADRRRIEAEQERAFAMHAPSSPLPQSNEQPRVHSQSRAPPLRESPTLRQSVAVVISMLAPRAEGQLKLSEAESLALLDVLAASDAGRAGADSMGNSALLHAVSRCAHGVAPLLATPATVDAENSCGQSPLGIAIDGDDPDMLEILMAAHVDLSHGQGALHDAIAADAFRCLAVLARPGTRADLARRDANGDTAMTAAAAAGAEQVVGALGQNAATLEQRNLAGESPLALAAKLGRLGIVIQLVQLGADVNSVDNSGRSVLMHALMAPAGEASAEVLLQLCASKFDVNVRDKDGNSALALAQQRGFSAVAAKLLSMGAQDFEALEAAAPFAPNPAPGFGW